jgi:hypothetical protein
MNWSAHYGGSLMHRVAVAVRTGPVGWRLCAVGTGAGRDWQVARGVAGRMGVEL